jgi:hypothetical protein
MISSDPQSLQFGQLGATRKPGRKGSGRFQHLFDSIEYHSHGPSEKRTPDPAGIATLNNFAPRRCTCEPVEQRGTDLSGDRGGKGAGQGGVNWSEPQPTQFAIRPPYLVGARARRRPLSRPGAPGLARASVPGGLHTVVRSKPKRAPIAIANSPVRADT